LAVVLRRLADPSAGLDRPRGRVEAVDLDDPRVGATQAGDDRDERCLAGAVGAEQAGDLARRDVEIDAPEGDDVAVGFAEPSVWSIEAVLPTAINGSARSARAEERPRAIVGVLLWAPRTPEPFGADPSGIVNAAIALADDEGWAAVNQVESAARMAASRSR
jgi:hypothetical protein